MATQRQIDANRRNSERSCGPKSLETKARSRFNATTHGCCSELINVEATRTPEFNERRARWAAEQNPSSEAGEWALDQAVAATFRIEQCGRTIDNLIITTQERARLAWDQDRAVEAATVSARLARDPVLAARQLETTLAGVCLLIEAWLGLAATLQAGEDWSEAEASKALDLLGVGADLRSGRTPIDDPEGSDSIAFRHELVLDELERLEALRDTSMIPLDLLERRQAMAGATALLSKPVKLMLRYERDAWNHYNQSMNALKTQAQPSAVEPPKVSEPAVTVPKPVDPEVKEDLVELDMDAEDAWFDALEKRIEAMPTSRMRTVPTAEGPRTLVPERSQFGDVAIAP